MTDTITLLQTPLADPKSLQERWCPKTQEAKTRKKPSNPLDCISVKDENPQTKEDSKYGRQSMITSHRKTMRALYLKKQEDRLVFLGQLQKTSTSKRNTMTATTFDHSSRPLTCKYREEELST